MSDLSFNHNGMQAVVVLSPAAKQLLQSTQDSQAQTMAKFDSPNTTFHQYLTKNSREVYKLTEGRADLQDRFRDVFAKATTDIVKELSQAKAKQQPQSGEYDFGHSTTDTARTAKRKKAFYEG
jgi:hypothetical protein